MRENHYKMVNLAGRLSLPRPHNHTHRFHTRSGMNEKWVEDYLFTAFGLATSAWVRWWYQRPSLNLGFQPWISFSACSSSDLSIFPPDSSSLLFSLWLSPSSVFFLPAATPITLLSSGSSLSLRPPMVSFSSLLFLSLLLQP